MCCYILPNFFPSVKKIRHFFHLGPYIIHRQFVSEAEVDTMRGSTDPRADLEDLIFDEDAGGPSRL